MLEFGEKKSNAQYRKTVGAVIYNPTNKKVLGLDWKRYSVYGIVQGGLEEGEDEVKALKREIAEETGYADYEIKEKLGENIMSYYYVEHKDLWTKVELSVYFVILNSDFQNDPELEEGEDFDLKWTDIDDFIALTDAHKPSASTNFEGLREFLLRAKPLIEKYFS